MVRWARGQGAGILAALTALTALTAPDGAPDQLPVPSTLTRALARLDGDALDTALATFRNLTISLTHLAGWTNNPAAHDHDRNHPADALRELHLTH